MLSEAVPTQVVNADMVPVVTIFATVKETGTAADSQPVELFLTLREKLYVPSFLVEGSGTFILVPDKVPALIAVNEVNAGEPAIIEN